MNKRKHIPSYVFLLCEYVAQLERIQYYINTNLTIPHEVLKNIEQRKEELKAITINDLDAEALCKEIVHSKNSKS